MLPIQGIANPEHMAFVHIERSSQKWNCSSLRLPLLAVHEVFKLESLRLFVLDEGTD